MVYDETQLEAAKADKALANMSTAIKKRDTKKKKNSITEQKLEQDERSPAGYIPGKLKQKLALKKIQSSESAGRNRESAKRRKSSVIGGDKVNQIKLTKSMKSNKMKR